MELQLLQANNGDAIHLRTLDEEGFFRNILIDGGTANAYILKNKKGDGDLKRLITEIRNRKESIDLLVLTHVDDDHIGGILKWFEQDKQANDLVKKVWFNSGRLIAEHFHEKGKEKEDNLLIPMDNSFNTSIKQGMSFEDFIDVHKIWDRRLIKNGDVIEMFGLQFTILSPSYNKLEKLLNQWEKEVPIMETAMISDYTTNLTELIKSDFFKEDASIPNGSSIAFIVEDGDKKMMFLGDAHPQPVIDSLIDMGYSAQNPVKVDYVKLSHHGSRGNTNYDLLNLVQSENFLISSDNSVHGLPDKQCLARIINCKEHVNLYFNYPELIPRIFSEQDYLDFPNFSTHDANRIFS